MGDAPGSDAWLKQVFDLAVRDALFPQAAVGSPLLVLLGGQPAAGKTRAQEAILTTHPELVSITGDDLRQYHPDYYDLCVSEPIGMPAATAPVSGGLVKFALDHALEHRYPVLLEGTFRDPEMVCGTATRFAAAGYRVEMVAVATPAPVSRLGTEQRYLGADHPALARWTPPEAHEVALVGSSRVVAALEASPAVSQTQVHSRKRLLYENTRTESGKWAEEPRGATVLRDEQERQLEVDQAASWLLDYGRLFELAQDRSGYLGPATIAAYQRLQQDAAQMLDHLAQAGTVNIEQLRRDQVRRQVIIEQLSS